MKQSLADELREVLSDQDKQVADLLMEHKQRRSAEVDHLARNTSVRVAGRTKHSSAAGKSWLVGAIATSAAAIVIVFNQVGHGDDASATLPRTTTPTPKHSEQLATTAVPAQVPAQEQVQRPARVSDSSLPVEVMLEHEADQQFVDMLADAMTDEATWSVTNDDVDKIIQESSNEDGI